MVDPPGGESAGDECAGDESAGGESAGHLYNDSFVLPVGTLLAERWLSRMKVVFILGRYSLANFSMELVATKYTSPSLGTLRIISTVI